MRRQSGRLAQLSAYVGEEAEPDFTPIESLREASAHFEGGSIRRFDFDACDCHLAGSSRELPADLKPLCGAHLREKFAIASFGGG